MNRRGTGLRIAIAIIIALAVTEVASGDPTVFVSPAELAVDAGEPFEMSIRVDAGYPDSVTAFLVDFNFDAELIELANAEEGSLFANCGYPTMFDWDVHAPGEHSCNDVTLGHTSHVFLPGELVALSFTAISPGETPITVTAVDLRDINRDAILPTYSADGFVTVLPVTGVEDGGCDGAVRGVRLMPNPSTGAVRIEFGLGDGSGSVEIRIHDVAGRGVAGWVGTLAAGGATSVDWDGRADSGETLPSGVYFVTVRAGGAEWRARCVLLR
jgi:hypothetical protein